MARNVRKVPKKAAKATSSSLRGRKAGKKVARAPVKKVGKPSASKKPKVMSVCAACHSPYLKTLLVDNKMMYTCLRCGYRSPDAASLPVGKVKKGLADRKREVAASHLKRRAVHDRALGAYLRRYPARLWLGLFGMVLVVIGVILVTSPEKLMAGLLLACGAVLAYLGERA